MVDTTRDKDGKWAASDLSEAGAPGNEIEITPAMIEAGERVILASGVWPDQCYGGWQTDLAIRVYQAMACTGLAKPYREQ
jgi:hypothetical protein